LIRIDSRDVTTSQVTLLSFDAAPAVHGVDSQRLQTRRQSVASRPSSTEK